MVATISAIGSSSQASSYYEADDYYADGGVSPSAWQGEGAKQLGLAGEVGRETFRDLLDGKLPDGQQLGTTRAGAVEHRPGWDVTMSAPKSVSIMAEVAGDRRLIAAHDRAVKTALGFAERHAAATRIRADGSVERQATGNLAIASFRHNTSRAQDPQLHTHNVIMNMTRDADGAWRSLGQIAARQAVAFAAENLGERQAVFAAAELEKEAGRFGMGTVSAGQIGEAIAKAAHDGMLVPRTFLDKRGAEFAGFTTADNVAQERQMLRSEAAGRGAVAPILSVRQAATAIARAELHSDHGWNAGQRDATRALLLSADRVTGVQGYAGTAKTTTVLATFAREALTRGLKVTALAPTASAAQTLGDALGLRGDTVARYLLSNSSDQRGGVWIVDEASMLSARDMASLLDHSAKAGARVVLVGDVKQLGSVGAGAAFAQLQAAGMSTAKLENIVRQTNGATRDAVLASIQGDARKALAALGQGGGRVIESPDRARRFAAMANAYVALDAKERARTLVIEPSREGRDALTADIRSALASTGVLSGPALTLQSLVTKNLTRAEARDPMNYAPGDMVRFTRDYADKGVMRGAAYRVEAIDPAKAAIHLASPEGDKIDWRLRQWGSGKAEVFETKPMELQTGDRVQFTRNDREAGRINGLGGTVTGIDPERNQATLNLANGREQQLDLANPRDAHLRHAYVQTAHTAQGQTAERVLIHADSRSANLVDQKMLYVALSRARAEALVVTDDNG